MITKCSLCLENIFLRFYETEICTVLHSAVKFRQNILICYKRINNCNAVLICDIAKNLIAIKELCLAEIRNSTYSLVHFKIIYNLLPVANEVVGR